MENEPIQEYIPPENPDWSMVEPANVSIIQMIINLALNVFGHQHVTSGSSY
jgi:hypothetical protein